MKLHYLLLMLVTLAVLPACGTGDPEHEYGEPPRQPEPQAPPPAGLEENPARPQTERPGQP